MAAFEVAPTGSGALDGLCFAAKDVIDIAGWKTGCGNPTWRDSHPSAVANAVCVEQLRRQWLLSSHVRLDECGGHWPAAAGFGASGPSRSGTGGLVAVGKAWTGCAVTGNGKESRCGNNVRTGPSLTTNASSFIFSVNQLINIGVPLGEHIAQMPQGFILSHDAQSSYSKTLAPGKRNSRRRPLIQAGHNKQP